MRSDLKRAIEIRSGLSETEPFDLGWASKISRPALVGSLWPPVAAPPVSVAGLRRRQGRGRAGGSKAIERAQGGRGSVASTSMATVPAQRHRRVAVHGGVAHWRRDLTPVSNRAQPRVGKGKIGARVIGYLNGRLRDP